MIMSRDYDVGYPPCLNKLSYFSQNTILIFIKYLNKFIFRQQSTLKSTGVYINSAGSNWTLRSAPSLCTDKGKVHFTEQYSQIN